jgi:hypothetical protein
MSNILLHIPRVALNKYNTDRVDEIYCDSSKRRKWSPTLRADVLDYNKLLYCQEAHAEEYSDLYSKPLRG